MKAITHWTPFVLRFAIGWHFLYEGAIKLFTNDWTAEGFLKGSYGFMSGIYHSMAANETILGIVNFLNVWGLILIGLGLILGALIRISSYLGMLVLLLYYFCYPPFGDTLLASSEGSFWIINRNFIEFIALAIVVAYPVKEISIPGIIRKAVGRRGDEGTRRRGDEETGRQGDVESAMQGRRNVIVSLATLPFAGGVFAAAAAKSAELELDGISGSTMTVNDYGLADLEGKMAMGKLGDLDVSRIIMGCNLISGYSHSRDLHYVSSLFLKYNTERKIMETMMLCEEAGINTTNIVLKNFSVFEKYKKITGSKIQTIAQVHAKPNQKDPLLQFKQARDFGVTSMYVQGGCADQLVKNQQLDWVQKAVEFTKSQGMLAGVGGHSIRVVLQVEEAGIKPDYYFKTVHHDNYWSAHPREFRKEFEVDRGKSLDHNRFHDNIFDIFPEQTVEAFSKIQVPLVGFKVLAGGAIKPKDGFKYAFESGSDFICVGMFDFQVVENVNLVNNILGGDLKRERPWYG